MTAGPGRRLFRQDGDYWTIAFAGKKVLVRDMKGLKYLAILLFLPQEDVSALSLVAAARRQGTPAAPGRLVRDDAERARTTVAKGLAAALRRIALHHPALGAHLEATIKRGYACRYTPAESDSAPWRH